MMGFKKNVYILVGLVVLALLIRGTFMFFNKNQGDTVLPSGLKIQEETVGMGAEAVAGKEVTVNYLGTLADGKKFDSSYDRNKPFLFVLGAGQVIQGWDQGFAGMKIGGKRKLTIPPELGYGNQNVGNGLIPPNSTLIFEVELLDVQDVK